MQAQQVLITDEVNAAIRKHCSFCTFHFPAFDKPLILSITDSAAIPYFHNCHTLLKAGRLEEADLFAQLTMVAIKDTLNNPLYRNVLYLQAKISQLKNATSVAIHQYDHYLVHQPIDSVLASDAYLSLAQLHINIQNWQKAETYLTTWNRYYLRFISTKTRNNLYDSVVYLFQNQKKIIHPDSAIQMGTTFFEERKDSIRLIHFYFQIADWYGPQSVGKALSYLKRGLALASNSNNLEQQKEGYLKASLLEEQRDHYKAALQYRKEYEKVVEQIRIKIERMEQHNRNQRRDSDTALQRKNPFRKLKNPLILFSVLLTFLLLYFMLVSINVIKNRRSLKALRNEVERLKELNSLKDEIFSIISHDLRSAVHTLQINITRLKALLSQVVSNAAFELAEHTERIVASVQSLLNNLLYWALNQIGKMSYQPEFISLQPLINGVCFDLQPLADAKNITLFYTLSESFTCIGDVNSVKIILRNLIDNAIKYTPDHGLVNVSARQETGFCFITVQDTGIGMSPTVIQALFTSDSRRIQQDASGRRSTGIGLWLAKNLTERNGGKLTIESEEGNGTNITVSLPING